MVRLNHEIAFWKEYDSAASWCAKRNYLFDSKGKIEGLPQLLSKNVYDTIMVDPESFNAAILTANEHARNK